MQIDKTMEEGTKMEEGTIVVSKVDNSEVLPLAIQFGVQDESCMHTKGCQDSNDMKHNIKKVAMDGDLSPKQIDRIKDNHSKEKKKEVAEIVSAKANSRQTRSSVHKIRPNPSVAP